MASNKTGFKDYLVRVDDETLSKTRRKMNKKSHKGRHYGMDHGYTPGGEAGGLGEAASGAGGGMHNGIIPGAFTPNTFSRGPGGSTSGKADMKKENRRNAPRKRSFAEFLKWRNAAEEEEWMDDDEEPMNDFDRFERNKERGDEIDDLMSARYPEEDDVSSELRRAMGLPTEDDPELEPEDDDEFEFLRNLGNIGGQGYGVEGSGDVVDTDYEDMLDGPENEEDLEDFDNEEDPEEYDDIDPEEELDFDPESELDDDEFDEEGIDDEDIEDVARVTGRFVDFYRDDDQAGHGEEYPEVEDVPADEFGDEELDDDEFERKFDVDPREEEAEEIGPGGFEPGQAIGPNTATRGTVSPGGGGSGGGQGTAIHRARVLFKQLINNPDLERKDIINEFMAQLGITESTAVSYYERLAKEAGMTGDDAEEDMTDEMDFGEDDLEGGMDGMEEPEMEMSQDEVDQQPPDRQGIIRQVDNAHLVYKRQMEDGGFEELWVYNIGDDIKDSLNTRRAILAGTDIPRGHTRSEDGSQAYTLSTMGNAQMLHITGLSN